MWVKVRQVKVRKIRQALIKLVEDVENTRITEAKGIAQVAVSGELLN